MIETSFIDNPISACRCYQFIERRHSRSGIFKSPNHSDYFSSNIPCILYIFKGSPGQIVKISFQSFRMRPQLDRSCVDYLELYLNLESIEMFTENKYDYRLCTNVSNQNEFYSKHNILVMKFHSYPSPSTEFFKGFLGKFKFFSKDSFRSNGHKIIGSKCSQQFFSSSNSDQSDGKTGHFFSPNYPQNYDSNMKCQYIFKAQPDERIILAFKSIYLDSQAAQCGSESQVDFILVTERISESKQSVLAHLCGVFKNVQIVSHGPLVTVSFISNKNGIERKGFEAFYEFVAKYKVYATSFINSSLDLDLITKVDIESETKVEEYEYYSKSNKHGRVSSPNFPRSYPNDCEIYYIFYGFSTQYVEISFQTFKLRSLENCHKHGGDRIEIYDGEFSKSTVNTKSPDKVFCGNSLSIYKSHSSYLTLKFVSDSSSIERDSGFIFEYNFISTIQTTLTPTIETVTNEKHKKCIFYIHSNGTFTKGRLLQNLERLNNKDNENTCKWILTGTKNQRIVLKLWNSGVQSDSNNGINFISSCRLTKELKVLSYHTDSPVGYEHTEISRWCNAEGVYSIMSSNEPRMDVIMHLGTLKASSDRYNVDYEFRGDFGVISNGVQIDQTCHFQFDSSRFRTGNFSSPNYPGYIPSNIACVYVFKGSVRSQIQIFLTEREPLMYQSLDCSENNGNVLRFESCSVLPLEIPQTICRQNKISKLPSIIWSDNCLRISLTSKGKDMYKGFFAQYIFFEIDQPKITAARNTFNTANSLIILMTVTFLMIIC